MLGFIHLLRVTAIAAASILSASASEFLDAPANEATKMIEEAEPFQNTAYCKQAIAARRVDLLALMFESRNGLSQFISHLQGMPHSKFREEVILMMLRSPSRGWFDVSPGHITLNAGNHQSMVALCVNMMKESISVDRISFSDFENHATRIRLADTFEEALNWRIRMRWLSAFLMIVGVALIATMLRRRSSVT